MHCKGSWHESARNIVYNGDILECELNSIDGNWIYNKLKFFPQIEYHNINGILKSNLDNLNIKFVSIGPNCSTADILKENNLRIEAFPFDYIFSSLEMIKHCINNKFNIFLDKQYYTPGICSNSTKHSFYCKLLDTPVLLNHYININFNYGDLKPSDGNLFNHHNLIDDNDNYVKFVRRCERLLNLIENNKKIVFVYYNSYTDDYNDIVDFYNNFSYNKNIYIVGIFQNNYDKKILYENTNCKIYQNYDTSYIFSEIMQNF